MKHKYFIFSMIAFFLVNLGYSQEQPKDIVDKYIKSGYSNLCQYEVAVKKDKQYVSLSKDYLIAIWPDYFSKWMYENTEYQYNQTIINDKEVNIEVKSTGPDMKAMNDENKNILTMLWDKYFPDVDAIMNDKDKSISIKYYEELYSTLYKVYQNTEFPIGTTTTNYKVVKEGRFWKIDFNLYEDEIKYQEEKLAKEARIKPILDEIKSNIVIFNDSYNSRTGLGQAFFISLKNNSKYVPDTIKLKFSFYNDKHEIISEDIYDCYIIGDRFKPGYSIDEIITGGQYGLSFPSSEWDGKTYSIEVFEVIMPYDFEPN